MPVVKPGKLNSRFEKNKKQYIHHYELHNIPWPFLAILCNDVLLVIYRHVYHNQCIFTQNLIGENSET